MTVTPIVTNTVSNTVSALGTGALVGIIVAAVIVALAMVLAGYYAWIKKAAVFIKKQPSAKMGAPTPMEMRGADSGKGEATV